MPSTPGQFGSRAENFTGAPCSFAAIASGVSSQAFNPTPKDSGLLSVYDGALMTAEASFFHYTGKLGLKAVGTVSVSTDEVDAVGLSWRPDPEPFPEHAVIDFTTLGASKSSSEKV